MLSQLAVSIVICGTGHPPEIPCQPPTIPPIVMRGYCTGATCPIPIPNPPKSGTAKPKTLLPRTLIAEFVPDPSEPPKTTFGSGTRFTPPPGRGTAPTSSGGSSRKSV